MSRDILLTQIDPDPDQPRKHFDPDALAELAQSIKENGLAVPILLRPAGERFIIVHGERRYRAVGLLRWETIPAEVRDITADEARWLALVENVQRNDLRPTEEAQAYQALLATGATQETLGQRIGKGQSYIATKLRFLKLPAEVQSALDNGVISEGHAKQLLRIDDTEALLNLYQMTREKELTVKALSKEAGGVVGILEARKRQDALANLYEELSVSDDDLLQAVGCEPAWHTFWEAEGFKHCHNRVMGVFARFMYTQGERSALVYAENFTPDNQLWFEAAAQAMHRKKAKSLAEANLIFVHFPASGTNHPELVRHIADNAKQDAVIVYRAGSEVVGIPDGHSATGDEVPIRMAFKDYGFNPGIFICATLAELPLPAYIEADLIRESDRTGEIIECYETWTVLSRSKESLEQGHFVYANMSRDI